ncbi:MAG: hypothetical protein GYB49_00865 [Alphaproteobacteria bacterium]|nr:hypothetical protein [Hyphomonas sp.]MBR9805765.1 hypothetical protein [Alphaproteobacteria bacterium]|tara:strand:+ start:3152 stop:3982 length:831 start_codon:yes stop_codon:yes gene_type:complete
MFAMPSASQVRRDENAPEACKPGANGHTDHQACFEAAEPKSGAWLLAAMNLGSQAFWNDDFETAAYYYDLSTPDGMNTFSDIILHANRSKVFLELGRTEDALRDANMVWQLAQENKADPMGTPLSDEAKFYALMLIIETFYVTSAPELELSLKTFMDITPSNEMDMMNLAAVLAEVERYDDAYKYSSELLKMAPENATALNNHCHLLTSMQRAKEALPLCEKAITYAPGIAAFHHSHAMALGALGKCTEANISLQKAHSLEPSAALYKESVECHQN